MTPITVIDDVIFTCKKARVTPTAYASILVAIASNTSSL